MFDAVISFLIDFLFYWIGVATLRLISFGKYRRKESDNPYLIALLGLLSAVVVMFVLVLIIHKL